MISLHPWPTKKIGLIALICLISFRPAYTQTLIYDIVKGGSIVGTMKAEKKITDNQLVYNIESVTSLRIVVKIKVVYNMTETYIDGILQHGHAISTLNGAVQNESKVKRKDGYYRLERVSDVLEFDADAITYSISEIYFSEPIGKREAFSQMFASYLPVIKLGDKMYELESDDGKNVYTYQEGICTQVKVNRSYATFYIKLREQYP